MNIILVWEHMAEEDRCEARRLVACAAAIIAIVVLCLLFVFVPIADAKIQPASAQPSNSLNRLPYIVDANPIKPGEYQVIVECAGHIDAVKVNKKKAKRVRKNMWTFKAKAGKLYKISAGQKAISYRIER